MSIETYYILMDTMALELHTHTLSQDVYISIESNALIAADCESLMEIGKRVVWRCGDIVWFD